MHRYTVQLFAAPREAAGQDRVQIESSQPLLAGEILNRIGETIPQLQAWTEVSRLAVNDAYVGAETPVRATDALSLIPPVSGG